MSYSTTSASPSDRGRIALATVQIVLSLLAGVVWLLLGVGVAMCTDAGPSAQCNHVSSLWGLTGLAVLASMIGGAVLMVGANSVRGSSWRTATAWIAGSTALALVVAAAAFCSAASAPIS